MSTAGKTRNSKSMLNIFNDKKTLYYLVLQKYDFDKKERSFVRYLLKVFVGQYKEYLK
jgi:hypothetical protein